MLRSSHAWQPGSLRGLAPVPLQVFFQSSVLFPFSSGQGWGEKDEASFLNYILQTWQFLVKVNVIHYDNKMYDNKMTLGKV